MDFTNLHIPASLNTSSHDFSNDFFIPILKTAKYYDRGVGFFSSGWLKINSVGIVSFAANGGKARWITSPILSKEDWAALALGDEGRQNDLVRQILASNIENLQNSLEKDTLSALSWMIADHLLDFRIAILRGKLDGEFHDKFGIFTDVEGQSISFSGSYNESIQGTRNYDAFKVFKSWIPNQKDWVDEDVNRFERLWSNQDPNVRVLDIGDANRQNILKLREINRPYHKDKRELNGRLGEDGLVDSVVETTNLLDKDISLRPYQVRAVECWFINGCRGFFEMATGTGKTFTSLAGAKQLWQRENKLAIVIAVPYQHLVEQWKEEAAKFGFSALLAYKSKNLWINKLNALIVEYNTGFRNFFCVITTHDTFASEGFQTTLSRLNPPSLIIADEAHHLGSETAQKSYPQSVPYRLALSATPNRWYDDRGTAALRNYFGQTVFEFTLGEAIGVSLTPYYYYPVLVDLTPAELNQYEQLSHKIARLYGKEKNANEEKKLKILFLKRANILNKAENKLLILSELLNENPIKRHTLFYCAPGQIDDVIHLVGFKMGCLIHAFTSKEDNSLRRQLLNDFAIGNIQALAAIKCLDEGVDVPNTETAYLLSSTSNPREFIQRRGRILRKATGKEFSYLYDLITIPPDVQFSNNENDLFQTERSIVRRELNRFKEFAEYAENKHHAIDIIWQTAQRYQLIDF